ncbi:hypothetical protein BTM25_24660 [Actinomadura rubteroloni]|uniref:DUF5753 domain-containing protein n=1 Tax=Actinomadura rubteroloni TaxID=1926885 RepID=A0A2P4UFK6_9ACTN|nr:helix-turn-helix transcriptional regulator [Actinomadura rubteroloni]POM23840.1 hypothetical protein BTM25_24660 [Actinomadura rubteroloni]
MTNDRRDPNINARRLGLYLRRAREVVGLSYAEAAERTGRAVEALIRVETGFAPPTPAEVHHLLGSYRVLGSKAAGVMIELAYRPDGPPWLARHAGRLRAPMRDVLISEAEASVVRSHGMQTIPELARCEAYARTLALAFDPEGDPDAEWDLILNRQRYRAGGKRRRLDVIVDEIALTALEHDPALMTAQLRHLLDLADDPDTTVRVIPRGAPLFGQRCHRFDVLEFPGVADRISVAHFPVLGAEIQPGDLTEAWERIEERAAASPDESRALLAGRLVGRAAS